MCRRPSTAPVSSSTWRMRAPAMTCCLWMCGRCSTTGVRLQPTGSTNLYQGDIGVGALVGPVSGGEYAWDVTDLVQRWLSREAFNFGLELRCAGCASSSRSFHSREFGSYAPRLVIDFGAVSPATSGSISGRVYEDADGNGAFGAGDSGVDGVRVELFRSDRGRRAGQTTAARRRLRFSTTCLQMTMRLSWMRRPSTSSWSTSGCRPAATRCTWATASILDGIDFRVARRPTPPPRPAPSLDLTAEDIEIIQVVSGQPLVKGKLTMARVYGWGPRHGRRKRSRRHRPALPPLSRRLRAAD